ncbi:hypothetical protein CDIK_4335 [Cucumispora dikerogammari]|nr:hypothetical protein CDIK_4335 [Cucumispora dikerogammari]
MLQLIEKLAPFDKENIYKNMNFFNDIVDRKIDTVGKKIGTIDRKLTVLTPLIGKLTVLTLLIGKLTVLALLIEKLTVLALLIQKSGLFIEYPYNFYFGL